MKFLLSISTIVVLLLSCINNQKKHNQYANKADTKSISTGIPYSKFRIIVFHHPEEEYFPMDPLEFIKKSRLLHQRPFNKDLAYNKKNLNWLVLQTKDSSFYNIPKSIINQFNFRSGKNSRPNDKNNSNFNVYLETESNLTGKKIASGIVPSFTYLVRDGRKQYWLFYGYNYSKVLGLNLSHQGDWESVTLDIKDNAIQGAWLSAHGKDNYYRRQDLEIFSEGDTQTLSVFSAMGTHAIYNKPGSFHILKSDQTAKGGTPWVITDLEADLNKQWWRNYAGAWGTIGIIAATTGPLGPLVKIIK